MSLRPNPFRLPCGSRTAWVALMALAAVLAGCDDEPDPESLATASTSLEPSGPETETSLELAIDSASSSAEFLMEAPLEHIQGRAPGSVQGELFVDLTDLTKSRGLVKVDLDELEILQQKRDSEQDDFGERAKSDTQNEHMRTWLEISDDAPSDVREKNRWIEYRITRVGEVSEADVTSMTGAERKVTAAVTGDFRLHGRKVEKQAKVELRFELDGDELEALHVKTLEPVPVGLAEHDVRPRSAFGKLAEKTLAAMGQKVADTAPVTFELTARPEG